MFMKMLKIVGVTALIAGLVVLNVAVGQASAEATAGFGPETAIAPTVGWTTVEPGTTHWYTFDYDYVGGGEGDSQRAEAGDRPAGDGNARQRGVHRPDDGAAWPMGQ